ncbi:MFS transporter, partial [Acinetobacter baumannii]
WVLTSYVLASAVALPLAGWLVNRVGLRRLMLGSVLLFTVASMLCGAAQTIEEMVLFRILQGLAGAFLAPLAQTITLDSSTLAERPRMMSI